MMGNAARKPLAVHFGILECWSVSFFRSVSWQWTSECIHPLGKVLKRVQIPVESPTPATPIIEKISFGGDLSILPPEKRGGYKGRLFRADSGHLIYSKIRVKQGSACVVPTGVDWVAVSSEYPVYEVDADIADSAYIELVLRSAAFQHYLDGLSHGGSTKTRIHPDQFGALAVPIPPLPVQRKIVAYWEKACREVGEFEKLIAEKRKSCFDTFRKQLGISRVSEPPRPKFFTVPSHCVTRWGYDLVWRSKNQSKSFQFPVKPLKELCTTGSGGTPSRKHKDYYGGTIPWVKTTEVTNAVILKTGEQITDKALASSSAKVYPAGSLVIAMYGQGATRGRTGKLGVDAATNQACLVITNVDDSLDADFFWYYLMISYEEMRELASGNNQPNLSAELLGNFPVPIPPKHVQMEFMGLFEQAMRKIASLEQRKVDMADESSSTVEKLILGTLPVEEL